MVGETGEIMATVRSRNVIVSGTVTGNVFATERLVLHKTARVEGDIEAGSIAIEEGAILNGRITMSGMPKKFRVARLAHVRGYAARGSTGTTCVTAGISRRSVASITKRSVASCDGQRAQAPWKSRLTTPLRVDADQLDVAAVDQQAGAQPIHHALDLRAQALGELGVAVHAQAHRPSRALR